MDYHDYTANDYDYDYEYDPNYNYDEETDSYEEDADSAHDYDNRNHSINSVTEIWLQLRIDGQVVCVSSRGRVKPFGSLFSPATDGITHLGTPYKTYKIANKMYYVHELVWLAFNGPIMDGYEIRHNSHYVNLRPRRTYSNHLECLVCLPKSVTHIHRIPRPS